jgi:hypothetical protein
MFKLSELLSKVAGRFKSSKVTSVLSAGSKIAKQGESLKTKAAAVAKPSKAAKELVSKAPKQSVVAKVSEGLFLKNTSKTLEKFYSKNNLSKISSMLESDLAVTKTELFTSKPTNLAVRGELAVRENQNFISKAESLNFFSVFKEFKAQEKILTQNPSLLKSKTISKGFEKLKVELGTVEQELHAVYKRKFVESSLNSRLSSIDEGSKIFVEAQKALLK